MDNTDQQLPKTNAEWSVYYQAILQELTDNQKRWDNRYPLVNFLNFL